MYWSIMAKVFISYSRKDVEFAKRLTEELPKSDLDFWIDWEGIPPTVDWRKEIEKGISEADAFLFLISPDSVESRVCKEELDCAIENGKRLIPIVVRDVQREKRPESLKTLNFIYFRASDDFETALRKLTTAVQTDFEWVAAHRRLQVKALDWESNNKDNGFLLRGRDLLDAEQDLATNTSKDPHPTNLQREYVFESRKATDKQRRLVTSISIAGLIALAVLAVFGFVQASFARAEARRANAGRLAIESKSVLTSFPERAALLALEAVRISQDANEPVLPEAEEALRLALQGIPGTGLPGFGAEVSLVQFTNDDQWLVAGSVTDQGQAHIWNVDKLLTDSSYEPAALTFPTNLAEMGAEDFTKFYVSPQSTWLVVDNRSESYLWRIADSDEAREQITIPGRVIFLNQGKDRYVLGLQPDKVTLWRLDPDIPSLEAERIFAGEFATMSEDQKYFITDDGQKGLILWEISPALDFTATELGRDADHAGIKIDPNNRWVIILENMPSPNIEVPVYDLEGNETGREAWNSTNIVLMSLDRTKPVQHEFQQELAVDADSLTFNPDGGILTYSATDAAYETFAFGLIKLTGAAPQNLQSDSIEDVTFINKDWVLDPVQLTFYDLRENDLLPDASVDTPVLFDDYGEVMLSGDRRLLLLEDNQAIDLQQLYDVPVVLESTSALPPSSTTDLPENAMEKLEALLTDNPQAAGLEERVTAFASSHNGAWYVAGTSGGGLRFWNVENPWESSRIQLENVTGFDEHSMMSFSNDNQWMAVDNKLWHLKNGKPVGKPIVMSEDADLMPLKVFSPDSRWLALVNGALPVQLLDLDNIESGLIVDALLNDSNGNFHTLLFSPNSHWLLLVGQGESYLYDLIHQSAIRLPYDPRLFAFTGDGKHIVLIAREYDDETYNEIWLEPEVWALPVAEEENFVIVNSLSVTEASLTLSRDGRWLVTGGSPAVSETRSAQLWNLQCIIEKQECAPLTLDARVDKAAFSPDSKYLITSSFSESYILEFSVWEMSTTNRRPVRIYDGKEQELVSLMLGKTAKWIILADSPGSSIGQAGIVSYEQGYASHLTNNTFDGYAFQPSLGVAGGTSEFGRFQTDYQINLYPREAMRPNRVISPIALRGHESIVSNALISPDERFVLTYSGDLPYTQNNATEYLLRLWDMEEMSKVPIRVPVVLPFEEGNQLSFMAFSPDSAWIYLSDRQGGIHYFPTSIEGLKKQACHALGRNMIIHEWQRLFLNAPYRKTCENLPEHPSAILETTSK
jgi:WD40 repeat protein